MLPLLGVMSTGEVAINYLNSTNYMFLGGLIMAIAVEHCGLHNRVALRIIMLVSKSRKVKKVSIRKVLGWNKSSSPDAGIHVHYNVLVYVDLKHRHYRHDASNR